mmetsp:Transcript_66988/g.174357  ORF Transcript_66988/g.174357 Transcript_66988/m.174357 type:complete len:225 (+) Transcript_66988:597-1271(+)
MLLGTPNFAAGTPNFGLFGSGASPDTGRFIPWAAAVPASPAAGSESAAPAHALVLSHCWMYASSVCAPEYCAITHFRRGGVSRASSSLAFVASSFHFAMNSAICLSSVAGLVADGAAVPSFGATAPTPAGFPRGFFSSGCAAAFVGCTAPCPSFAGVDRAFASWPLGFAAAMPPRSPAFGAMAAMTPPGLARAAPLARGTFSAGSGGSFTSESAGGSGAPASLR